ncbi:MAG: hypothetical protein QNJ70_32200 [Xenococcaceae cyanobacterium MO_207.B15]|nr:hypothetical protein [Xenococcaceae cyanobacterium MO_207.B15]
MKFRAMAIILLSLTFIMPTQLSGQASEVDELFSFCSRFPHNSKCKDYTAPIPLKNRSGEEVLCLLGNQEELEKCKFLLTEKLLTFYVETGKGINVLDGAKDTKEVTFPINALESFSYSEKKKTNTGLVIAFGLFGLLSNKKTSTFNLHFKQIETIEEVKTTELLPRRAIFVVKRKIGREIRKDIEQKTNLVADILDIE